MISGGQISNEVTTAQTVTKAAIGLSFIIGMISAIATSSSSSAAFASINQIQLYMLMPLVGTGLHKNVVDYIVGFKLSVFSFGTVNLESIFGTQEMVSYFNCQNSDQYLSDIGVGSLCTIKNIVSDLIVLILLGVCHIFIIIPGYS